MSFAHAYCHSFLSLVLVSLLFHHFVRPTLSQSPPPPLIISKLQEALPSESIKYAKMDLNPKLGGLLQHLIRKNNPTDPNSPHTSIVDSLIRINDKREVLLDVLGESSPEKTLESVLIENGCQVTSCVVNRCSVILAIDKIDEIANTKEILTINLALPNLDHQRTESRTRRVRRSSQDRDLQGSVTSEAVRAMFVDLARSRYSNINGTGITVGIMSDSFDCDGNQAQIDIQTGDLPPFSRINVLADLTPGDSCIDEGRAMMQLVYDIAPGVNFAFHTAFRGQADFATGIRALADVGCQIIVDDVGYFAELMFQDGIISQAVNEVASRGVSYFTSVGNSGNAAWVGETGFRNSNLFQDGFGQFHSFGLDSDGNHVIFQPFEIKRTSGVRLRSEIVLFLCQWDEPGISTTGAGGSRSEVDIYVVDENGFILSSDPFTNIGNDPTEIVAFDTFDFAASGNSGLVTAYVAIAVKEGPPPAYMKIVSTSQGVFNFTDGTEATNIGHANTATGASVGAAYYRQTPAYGVSPPKAESFSSFGGTPIFFDKDSNRLPAREIRRQPRFTGPDGTKTTFFGDSTNNFFGTSASAPNVAAVAALMMQLQTDRMTPNELFQILDSSAIDMTSTVGFDFISGYGFVNASKALDAVSLVKAPNAVPTRRPTKAPTLSPKQPTVLPTREPTKAPALPPKQATVSPTRRPTKAPTVSPTRRPTKAPTLSPKQPTVSPSRRPTKAPTLSPKQATVSPTRRPTKAPTLSPKQPTVSPTRRPTEAPTRIPCGLFGASLFCPLTFGGIVGRFIRGLLGGF